MAPPDSDPPDPARDEEEEEREEPRRGLERLLPDLIRKGVEAGLDRLGKTDDSLRSFILERKLPKEIASYILAQIDETKNGLFRVVAKEIRDFLEQTNLADEMRKALTSLSFEIKTEIRFIPNDAGGAKPEVKVEVKPTKS